jgi:hypothetical protein
VVEAQQMSDHVVRQWRRHGHDRLYVQTADGTSLGYWDTKGGHAVVQDEASRATVEAAALTFLASSPARPVHSSQAGPPDDIAGSGRACPAPLPDGALDDRTPFGAPSADTADVLQPTDLALNRPGQAAREQAVALRQAAPVRTDLARVLGVHTEERAWRIGADGEQAVAAQLARLGAEWLVLHAIPVGNRGSDIDHLVIGPGGVFTINAKHHPDASIWVGGNTFMVNGQRQPYVRNSRHEAQRASRILTAASGFPVAVTGVIAVMGAQKGFTVREQPPGGDVNVVTRRDLVRWLRRRPSGALKPDQSKALYEAARRSTTWQAH